jgi:O-antigen/teichoic acid export membrane protein
MSRAEKSTAVDVARGSSYLFLQSMATNVMMVVSFSILARLITPLEMGGMAVLFMVIGASRVVACIGMPSSVTRFMAESMARNDRAKAAGVFYQAIRTNLVLSSLVGMTVFLSAGNLSSWLLGTSERAILFQILAFDIVIAAGLLPTLNSAMLGLQKIREMSAINIVYMVMRQTLIVAFTFATRSLLGLVIAWVVSELAVALTFFKYVRSNVGSSTLAFDFKHLVRFSFPLFLQDAANYGYAWFDQVALLSYLSLESLGVYTTVIMAFGVLGGVAAAIGTSLFPTYSVMHEEHGSRALADSSRGATRYLCLIVVPLSLGLFSVARPSLTLFVGEVYSNGTGPLMILSLFFAFTLTSTAFAGLPVVLGDTVLSLKLAILNIILGAASALILLPSLGIVGAAIARGITMVASLLTVMIALKSRIGVGFDVEAFWKALVSGGVMAVAVLLAQVHYYSKYLLPVYVILGGSIYFAMLLLLRAIKRQDVQLLGEYVGSRFRFIVQPLEKLITSSGN